MWEQHIQDRQTGMELGRRGGDASWPSLLMIHGAGGRGQNYLPQLSGIRGVNVAAIDLPGHGDTSGPGMESVEDYAGWLAGVIAAGPLRPVLLGHSMGGAIAMTLALKHPELVGGLILAGTGSRLKVMPGITQGISVNFEATIKMIVGFAYHKDADPQLIAQGGVVMTATGPDTLLGDFTACNAFDISAELGDISQPTLVLVGDGDLLTPPKFSQALVKGIPGAQMQVIQTAGHMSFIEQPAVFNKAVAGFMADR